MNEVYFSAVNLVLVNEYNDLKDKSLVSWGDEKFKPVRKQIKDHYLKEQDYTCAFCRQRFFVKSNRAWDAEHIISKTKYPNFMFEPTNLCISCPDCNNEKSDKAILNRLNRVRFPKTSKAYKIIHPHFDKYEEHLVVLVEGKLYEWKTPKGRFTIQVYGLDRFMEDTGRTVNRKDIKIQKLMKSALTDHNDFEKNEQELLEELLLKYSSKIGNKQSLKTIKKLRGST